MKEFKFAFTIEKTKVLVDDTRMIIKRGIFYFYKVEFPISAIQNYYVNKINYGERGSAYNYLVISFIGRSGKIKRIELHASLTASSFTELVNELQSRMPTKSLNHLEEAEALKILKTTDWRKIAPLIGSVCFMALMIILFIPELVHYADTGFAQASLADVTHQKDLGTRNISIRGRLLHESIATSFKGRYNDYYKQYIPLVADDWKAGDSIKIILLFRTQEEKTRVRDREEYIGVIRDVAWEGMDASDVEALRDLPVNLPDHPVLVDITWSKRNNTGTPWILGVFFILTCISYFSLKKKLKVKTV